MFFTTFVVFLLIYYTDLQPYLLFADRVYGAIYRSNLNGSDIQQLVRGLPGPFALDFDYRYSASKYSAIIINVLTLDQNLTWGVEMWTGAGPPGGLWGPRANTKSGAHTVWGCLGARLQKILRFYML